MIPSIEKMRLNKFQKVHLPRVRDLVGRYGLRESVVNAPSEQEVDFTRNKLDNCRRIQQEVYESYAREEAERARSAGAESHRTEGESVQEDLPPA